MLVPSDLVTRRVWNTLVVVLCLVLIPVGAPLADAQVPVQESTNNYGDMVEYPLVFPVAGDYTLSDTFYAARSNGDHHAQDIMSAKMTPIVAAASGTIRYINWTRDADQMRTNGRCCTMTIVHDDGWQTWYLHMNNDTPGTDDGLGWGIADGLEPGDHVQAGQLIGWVGDSGNAEYTRPHLHFELIDPDGVIVNPYQALLAAADPGTPFASLGSGSSGQQILQLQTMLSVIGFDPGPADGVFGSLTEGAVTSFQSSNNLSSTGVVDGATWDAIVTAYLELVDPPTRLAGNDRYSTAAAVADHAFPGTAPIVFLGVGTNFPDAIGAGPAAAALGAPVLLVRSDAIPPATQAALSRLDPDTVYILGGEVAVGPTVDAAVRSLLPDATVERLAGATRYETAVEVSKTAFDASVETVYVVTGASFPDALVAAPAAVVAGGPVLLVQRTSIPAAVGAELERLSPQQIVVVGGTSAVSSGVLSQLGAYADSVIRLSGATRYATAASVGAFAYPDGAATAYVAVGDRFPDALTGGAATTGSPGPLLLVESDSLPLVIANELRRLDPSEIYVFGGPGAVSESVGLTLAGIQMTTAPPAPPPAPEGPPKIVYDSSQGAEQWRPLVEYVFAMWGLDAEKCGTGDRAGDCIGPQVDNAIIIMQCESSGDPTIVNPISGTTGLFQHRPLYWADRTARVRTHFADFPTDATPYDPYDNIMVAALLVDESRDALLGYNSFGVPWSHGPEPWGHWDGSARATWCHDPPLVTS